MRRRNLFLSCSLLTVGLIACTVTSNVGDLPRSGDAEAGSAETGGNLPETSVLDAPLDPDSPLPKVDAGCGVTFAQEATAIDVQVKPGVEPDQSGGNVLAGTYVLTALDAYHGNTTGTARVRETMEVRGASPTGTLYRLIEITAASGTFVNVPLHGETSLYQAEITTAFQVTPQCPKKTFAGGGRYTASGDTLAIFDSMEGFVRTYRRVH